jgi:hypothetical protein
LSTLILGKRFVVNEQRDMVGKQPWYYRATPERLVFILHNHRKIWSARTSFLVGRNGRRPESARHYYQSHDLTDKVSAAEVSTECPRSTTTWTLVVPKPSPLANIRVGHVVLSNTGQYCKMCRTEQWIAYQRRIFASRSATTPQALRTERRVKYAL